MRFFGSSYRDMPHFVLRRIDHMAGEVNGFLLVFAIALGMLTLLCLVQKVVDSLPPPTPAGAHKAETSGASDKGMHS